MCADECFENVFEELAGIVNRPMAQQRHSDKRVKSLYSNPCFSYCRRSTFIQWIDDFAGRFSYLKTYIHFTTYQFILSKYDVNSHVKYVHLYISYRRQIVMFIKRIPFFLAG